MMDVGEFKEQHPSAIKIEHADGFIGFIGPMNMETFWFCENCDQLVDIDDSHPVEFHTKCSICSSIN